MRSQDDRELLRRLLAGERPAVGSAGEDDASEARFRALSALWDGLGDAPPSAPPLGFAARVMAAVRAEAAAGAKAGFSGAPRWAQLAAPLALATGIAAGVSLAWRPPPDLALAAVATPPPGLAEGYLEALTAWSEDGGEVEP